MYLKNSIVLFMICLTPLLTPTLSSALPPCTNFAGVGAGASNDPCDSPLFGATTAQEIPATGPVVEVSEAADDSFNYQSPPIADLSRNETAINSSIVYQFFSVLKAGYKDTYLMGSHSSMTTQGNNTAQIPQP